jgi:hypothetical protein
MLWQFQFPLNAVRRKHAMVSAWPTKSELRCAYYGRNKARIFNGAIDSANLKKFTIDKIKTNRMKRRLSILCNRIHGNQGG